MVKKTSNKKKVLLVCIAVFAVMAIIFSRTLINGYTIFTGLLFNKEIELKKDPDHGVNILLLGRGGGKHEGPDLTDTIIVASINPQTNKVFLISIPRDLWIPDVNMKINGAYAFGQEKENKGMLLAKAAVSKVTGLSIDYVLVIDFSGFEKLVDYLGGLEVKVPRTFDDYAYPITGKENELCGRQEEELEALATEAAQLDIFPCRYEHIHFDEGNQQMNGETALKFVRSRHAEGIEGSDFSRSQRQQEVILALKNKVLSLGLLLNPVKVVGVYNIIKENINTNIAPEEYDDFIKLARKMEKTEIKTIVIDAGGTEEKQFGLLVNPPISKDTRFQWVLSPRTNTFDEIQEYITCIEKGFVCNITEEGIEKIDGTISPTKSN